MKKLFIALLLIFINNLQCAEIKESEEQKQALIKVLSHFITKLKLEISKNDSTFIIQKIPGLIGKIRILNSRNKKTLLQANYGCYYGNNEDFAEIVGDQVTIKLKASLFDFNASDEDKNSALLTNNINKQQIKIKHKDFVRSVLFSPNKRYLATASDDGIVKVTDLQKFQINNIIDLDGNVAILYINFSPDSKYLAVSHHNTINVTDLDNDETIFTTKKYFDALGFSGNGFYWIAGTYTDAIIIPLPKILLNLNIDQLTLLQYLSKFDCETVEISSEQCPIFKSLPYLIQSAIHQKFFLILK